MILGFSVELMLKFKYNYIIEFADEIDNSKLLKVDIEQIKRKVRKNLIGQYLGFVEFETDHKSIIPLIPSIFDHKTIHDE